MKRSEIHPRRPSFLHEIRLGAPKILVAGVDEAGRGPLAGPVVAAAVILNHNHFPPNLNDSKLLSHNARILIAKSLRKHARIGVGAASAHEIDRLNILRASLLAMKRAFLKLNSPNAVPLIDGNHIPNIPNAVALPHADALSLSVAAASIVAKTTRDLIMTKLHQSHPNYNFHLHKGYPTPQHRLALSIHGPSLHHRLSFKPLKKTP